MHSLENACFSRMRKGGHKQGYREAWTGHTLSSVCILYRYLDILIVLNFRIFFDGRGGKGWAPQASLLGYVPALLLAHLLAGARCQEVGQLSR